MSESVYVCVRARVCVYDHDQYIYYVPYIFGQLSVAYY